MNRPIRSFVLRQGRTTPAQKRALDELLPKYGIPFSSHRLKSSRYAPLGSPLSGDPEQELFSVGVKWRF